MPLDPTARALLDILAAQGVKSFEQYDVPDFRDLVQAFMGLQATPQDVDSVIELEHDGLQLRAYRPVGAGPDPLPVVVYFHGGGWVGGTLDVVDEPVRALTNASGALFVVPEYRKAPEHKFPAATDDTFAALKWVIAHAAEFGGDPSRVAVMGDSAGATLATVAAIRARDEGIALTAQILEFPVIDATAQLPSKTEMAEGYMLHTAGGEWLWKNYLNDPSEATNPLASPAHAELEGLPPTLVISLEYDPTRDEAEAYAAQLSAAGVDTTQVRIDGLIHASSWMSGAIPRSAEILDLASGYIRARFAKVPAGV